MYQDEKIQLDAWNLDFKEFPIKDKMSWALGNNFWRSVCPNDTQTPCWL